MREGFEQPLRWTDLAEGQHGAISRVQLLEMGLSPAAIGRLITTKRLRPLWRGIYVVGGLEPTVFTLLMAATLLPQKPTVSHRAAAFLWRLLDQGPPVEVSGSTTSRIRGVTMHKKHLGNGDFTYRRGIRVTSPHRTLMDLGDVADRDVVEDALDRALELGITSGEWLQQELNRTGTKGKKGAAILRAILDDGVDERPPSWLERRFIRLLDGSPVENYRREFPVDRYRIDFAWDEVLLGVEVHGSKWHRKRRRWSSDLSRHNALTALGWTILHFTWEDIRTRPDEVISEIVGTFRRLRGWQTFSR